jgi:hypothetical protein
MRNPFSFLFRVPMNNEEEAEFMPFLNRFLSLVMLGFLMVNGADAAEPATESKRAKSKPAPVAEEIQFDLGETSKSQSASDTSKFEELQFEKSMVIEAKVERPQVQFPLLKEAPPEKAITFEASFREQILDVPRENTFQLK